MSDFWSYYIIAIVALNIGGCAWLLMWTRRMDIHDMPADGTTGHVYDGIREYNKPLPRWWLSLFWITIIFSLVYLVLYPGLGKFEGVLGWTSHKEVAAEEQAYQEKYGAMYAGYAKLPIEELARNEAAMKIAGRLFANNCATCHGADAHGARGFPNLTDNDWLHGGEPSNIEETILNGRNGVMPPWKEALGEDGVRDAAHYVRVMANLQSENAYSVAGQKLYATTCIACHGPDGKGNVMMGAPNLTDNVWLYGSSEGSLIKTIGEGRIGHMPAQKDLLGPERVHMLAAYVLSLSHSKP
ncbi:MAG: cytochrome-c oxidase, cbb3-type subunit III [Moraxellaceae bacterium]